MQPSVTPCFLARGQQRSSAFVTFLLCLGLFCLAAAPRVRAAGPLTVTTLDDTVNGDNLLSLREAILNSPAGGVINFAVTGTIPLDTGTPLGVGRNLTIVGPGARKLTVSGKDATGVFVIGSGAAATLSGLTITGGFVRSNATRGGGILLQDGSGLVLRDCALAGNRASQQVGGNAEGGAVYVGPRATLDARNCTFDRNGATAETLGALGGAVSSSGVVRMSNCTFIGNYVSAGISSMGGGGGLCLRGSATLTNCTIAANEVRQGQGPFHAAGGVLALDGSAVELRGTLIAANTAAGNPDGSPAYPDVRGPFTSRGHNLIGIRDGSTNTWLSTDQTGTVQFPQGAGLELDTAGKPSLKHNGGPTDTVALLPASAALNHGDNAVLNAPFNLTADQRGFPRRAGASVDVGAYERDLAQSGSTLVVNTLDDEDDGVAGTGHCSLREAIRAANSDTDADTISFRAGLSGTITLDPARDPLTISYPLALAGPGARALTLSGGRATRLFLNLASPVSISGLTLADGAGSGQAGDAGTLVNGGMLTMQSCTIRNNVPPGPAVSTLANGGSRLDVRNCTFTGNTGGALLNQGSTLVVTNSTLSGNQSAGGGGGIYNLGNTLIYPPAATTLLNCTVAGNTAGSAYDGGGGIYNYGGNTLILRNTLIARNTAAAPGPDVAGQVTSQGNNLVGNTTGSSGWVASDRTGIADPKLGALANNGGPTDTRALLAGSPAMNGAYHAAAPARDQRDRYRPDTADIGAFEFGGYALEPPANVSVTPSSGTSAPGTARLLTAKYADPNGAADFRAAYLLVNSSASGSTALYGWYDALNDRLYLRNNAGTAWLGGFAPGSPNTISDPAGKGSLNCAVTTVSRAGTTLTVNWSLTPNAAFGGNRNLYLSCQDRSGRGDALELLGTWSVAAAPVNVSISPNSGSTRAGVGRTLTAVYTDANGAADLEEARILVNAGLSFARGLYASYDAIGNKLYLRNDANTAWLGGFAPGSPNTISDPAGKGRLNCQATTVTKSGNSLTVRWTFVPNTAFAGGRNLYLWARDRTARTDGWDALGTWTITLDTVRME